MVDILPRSAWGARFPIPAGRHVALSARRRFVVHWPGSFSGPDPAAQLRAIEHAHVVGQGWASIGYNAAVSRDGRVWAGCGRDQRGIHAGTAAANLDGLGVVALVSVGEAAPWPLLDSMRALYEQWSREAGRRLAMTWHAAIVPTQCPGPGLTQWVRAGMPSGAWTGPPTGDDDDMTPAQNAMLEQLWGQIMNGVPLPAPARSAGANVTLDALLRDIINRLARLEARP